MESHKQSFNNSDDYKGITEPNYFLLEQQVTLFFNNLYNYYSETSTNSEDQSAILTKIEKNRRDLQQQTPKLVKTDDNGQSFMANWFLKLGTSHPDFESSSFLFKEHSSVVPKKSIRLKLKKRWLSDCDNDQSNEEKLEKAEPPLKRKKKEEKEPKIRRKEKYEEITEKRKKKNTSNLSEEINPPEVVLQELRKLKGADLKFVIGKKMEKSDLNKQLDRFSIPEVQIKNEFVNKNEKNELLGEIKEYKKGLPSIQVKVIEPCLEKSDMCLRLWILKASVSYVLNRKWNQIAYRESNDFKEHDKVQVWSFRVDNQLWFQIVKV